MSRFPSKISCLTVPKSFVGQPFCVSNIFCCRESFWIGGGGGGREKAGSITIFCQKFFSHSSEKFLRRKHCVLCFMSSQVAKSLWISEEGGREYQAFRSKTFCLTMPKFFLAEHFIFSIISGNEEIYADEGIITFLYGKIVV